MHQISYKYMEKIVYMCTFHLTLHRCKYKALYQKSSKSHIYMNDSQCKPVSFSVSKEKNESITATGTCVTAERESWLAITLLYSCYVPQNSMLHSPYTLGKVIYYVVATPIFSDSKSHSLNNQAEKYNHS